MAHEFHHSQCVAFHETDVSGLVHFSNYARYMESCEHAFVRSLGLSIHTNDGYGWPRVDVRTQFCAPLRFEDCFIVHLRVARKGRSSLTYRFDLVRDDPSRELIAIGHLTCVCVQLRDDGTLVSTPLPEAFDRAIEVAPDLKGELP